VARQGDAAVDAIELEVALLLQSGQMLGDRQVARYTQMSGDFTLGRWVAVVVQVAGNKIQHLLLASGRNCCALTFNGIHMDTIQNKWD